MSISRPELEDDRLEGWVEEEIVEEEMRPWRRVSTLAVVSVVVGVASSLIFMDWMLGILSVVGIALGVLAIRQIHRKPEVYTGIPLAWVGIGLSVLMLFGGMSWVFYAYFGAAPPGYIAVSYAELQPDPDNPAQKYPPRARELHELCATMDKKIFIKGFMYPGRQSLNMKKFSLNPFNGHCPYCTPTPKPTEVIYVELVGDLTADYTTKCVGVGGKFEIEEVGGGVVYRIQADYVR